MFASLAEGSVVSVMQLQGQVLTVHIMLERVPILLLQVQTVLNGVVRCGSSRI